jgi:F0F1-type ATP synthase assembly protein I
MGNQTTYEKLITLTRCCVSYGAARLLMPTTATLQMTMNDQRPAVPTSPATQKPTQKASSSPLAGMGAAWLMIGAVVFGVALGLGIDHHFNSMPWATTGCSILFMAAGIYLVIREGSR